MNNMIAKKLFVCFLVVLALSPFVFSQSTTQKLDKYVEKARKDWNVPGLSITVVKDDKVIFAKGYGIRELGKKDPVNTKTLFGAMSTTKAMTVAVLAMLVDEGKVNWDDKVIKHLPEFKVSDPYVTKEIKIRDLLTHNAGLGNADHLWGWTPSMPADQVVSKMQYAEPAYSFRDGFVYQNIMYLVAGRVIERVSGKSWEEFLKERLFDPLGMKNTYATYGLSNGYDNRSIAHFEFDGKIQPISESLADGIGPAGSVWSNADDIGKWVSFMLGNTTVNGKQLLKPETHREILKPHVIVPVKDFYPTTAVTKPNWTTYGLAWFQHDYRGEMVNFHTGSLAGRTAIIGLLADKKVGVYIFGNVDHAEVRHALMYKVFDLFAFDDDSRDWSAELFTLYAGLKEKAKKAAKSVEGLRKENTKPSLPMSDYTGRYHDRFYGDVEIKSVDGKMRIVMSPEMQGDVNHWHYDTFEVSWDTKWWGTSLIAFDLNPITRKVASIKFGGIEFARAAGKAAGKR
jgi:CubicO group peptidase (beta-lactamase class C family)